MNKQLLLLSFFSASLMLISPSCVPLTPQTRITANPSLFAKLPIEQKLLVQKGQIQRGMHKDGVFLAWGKPAHHATGSKSGKRYEKWIYTRSSPTYQHGIHPGIGYGGFGHRGWRGAYYGIGYSPAVRYVQRPFSSVSFNSRDKVTDWSMNQ